LGDSSETIAYGGDGTSANAVCVARQGRDNTVQFEHFLPSNDRTYNYALKNTTQIGDLHFVYNVGSWPDYLTEMAGNPASDGASIERLLEERHLSFPHRAAHVRMFHSPSADHQSELMIIYGEVCRKMVLSLFARKGSSFKRAENSPQSSRARNQGLPA
jgi:hypothetical protein